MNEYYDHGSFPQTGAAGSSAAMRAELELIEAGFNKLPDLVGNALKLVRINASEIAQEAVLNTTVQAADIVAATAKATPVSADMIPIVDSAAGNTFKKVTWADLFGTLDGTFLKSGDTAAALTITSATINGGTISGITDLAVLANSASSALTVTQTGSGNAFVVEDSASTDATPFVIDNAGNVGIGTAASSTRKVNIAHTQSDTANTEIANNVVATATNTSGAVTKIASFSNVATGTGYAGTGALCGNYAQATHFVTGTVASLIANIGIIANTSTGTVTSATNYQASSATNSGGGTISQQIGFICNDLTAATANYGFYSSVNSGANKFGFYANGTAENYFNGNVQLTKNLTFTGTGQRITGDFSNATVANRVLFQTSTTNGITNVGALPNGTATIAQFSCFGSADPANTSVAQMINTGSEVSYRSAITGSGSFLPMTFWTGGAERLRIDTAGRVGIGKSPDWTLSVSDATAPVIELEERDVNGRTFLVQDGNNFQIRRNTIGTNPSISIDSSGVVSFPLGTSGVSSLGVGQTWQDVTASRVSGTTYTNTSGRPIFVSVYSPSFTNNACQLDVTVNGLAIMKNRNHTTHTGIATVSFIVPNGSTYSVSSAGTTIGIGTWMELR